MDTSKDKFEVGDLVRSKYFTQYSTRIGVVVKALSETLYGESIYQIIWQSDCDAKESYERQECLEHYE